MYVLTLKKLFFLVIIGCVCFPSTSQIRQKSSINSLWYFSKQDNRPDKVNPKSKHWDLINLPHTWNDKDVTDDGKRGYHRGKGWYYKTLNGTFNIEQKNYFLHFEGANQYTEVYVNGSKAGEHIGGYSAFTIDITAFLSTENQNEILVMVDNSHDADIPPLSADFTFFGGIYRDVFLVETTKVHFNLLDYGSKGIYVSTPKVDSENAVIKVKGSFVNTLNTKKNYTIHCDITDKDGNSISNTTVEVKTKKTTKNTTFDFKEIKISNPNLWSPDAPYLYNLDISIKQKDVVLDIENIQFGIRSFSFDPDTGFTLNGKPYKLIGANRHQDYLNMGNALSDDQHRADLRLLKDMGANFIRLAHYPQDPAVLRAADQIGLMVWEETPLVNEITISKAHDDNSENMLKEMIRQHYNHPSVIIWGYMNEIYWAHRFIDKDKVQAHTTATVALAKRLEAVSRKEDPSRYTAMALHNYPLYETSGLDKIPQIVGWNLYHGWYYDTYEDFGKFLDQQHKKYPERIHFISEFGAGSDPRFHSIKPERFDFTIEGHKRMMESYLKQITERPFVSGATVWNLIDFSSERRIDPNPHVNNKGLVSADRTPKDVYFLFKAALSKAPYIKIAETNWKNRIGLLSETLPVQVYTNLKNVELFQNGKSLGVKKVNDHSVVWQVIFKNGKNKFEAKAPNTAVKVADYFTIDFKGIPQNITALNDVDISINAGSNHSFYDEKGKNTWLADKAYSKGSFGYLDGEPLYVSKKIGTKEDVLTITDDIGLYQTMRKNTTGYQFDVKDGWYEVELLLVEHYPKSRRFVDGVEPPKRIGEASVINVTVNDITVYKNLDLVEMYGYNYPLRKKVKVKAINNQGIRVDFKAMEGDTYLSAIRVRNY